MKWAWESCNAIFEMFQNIWGGSPATEQLKTGIESEDWIEAQCGPSVTSSSTQLEDEPCAANAQLVADEETSTSARRDLLDTTLKNYKQERLKHKLLEDAQLLHCAQEELLMKRRLVDRMEQMDKVYSENLIGVSKNMEKLANSISQGFAMLNSLIGQQTQYPYSSHHLPSLSLAILFIHMCYLIHPHLPLTALMTPLTLIMIP